ncbi:sporulation protein SpoOM [Bacillus taeanensis]|uniref:Sporulation protein SpoOM n=2 Tax=Bacillus taeanensis TaxID=273032 RepID=A0A366XY15_9BACI|nr:sporulation protein [Bacillus taeanensis]RBW69044.1 sporulation protein SpoOM [Bacillus taeanensis]
MSFMKKMLSSVGIGAAKVDTQLVQEEIQAGGKMSGRVVISGGSVQQDIDNIYLTLMTTYEKEHDDRKVTEEVVIAQYLISERFTIFPNKTEEIDFEFDIPMDTPITGGYSKVWVQTGLDIKNAIDPSDRDYLQIKAHPLAEEVFSALTDLGFKLRKVNNEAVPYRMQKRLPFVQEFEFIPISGPFQNKLDELEIVFFLSEESCELFMEVDRRAKGLGGLFSEMLDMDEARVRFTFTENELPVLTEQLEEVIRRFS